MVAYSEKRGVHFALGASSPSSSVAAAVTRDERKRRKRKRKKERACKEMQPGNVLSSKT